MCIVTIVLYCIVTIALQLFSLDRNIDIRARRGDRLFKSICKGTNALVVLHSSPQCFWRDVKLSDDVKFTLYHMHYPLGTVRPLYRTGVSLLSRERFLYI